VNKQKTGKCAILTLVVFYITFCTLVDMFNPFRYLSLIGCLKAVTYTVALLMYVLLFIIVGSFICGKKTHKH